MQFEFITTEQQLEGLATEWERLSKESTTPYQFFQDWYWVKSWWQILAPRGNYSLKIVVGSCASRVVMIWPWVINHHHGLQILEPMGGLMSCFDDALLTETQASGQILLGAWNFILEHADADAIELRAVHEQANIAELLDDVGGVPIYADRAPFIDLQTHDNFDTYLASRSKKMRQNQRRAAKYLGKQGEVNGSGDDQHMSADVAIDTSLSFKAQWLDARGLSGKTMLTDEARLFLKQVCRHYAQPSANTRLCISSLYLDDQPVSIGIGFRCNGCHYEYFGSFDYRLEQFGPGRLRMEYGMRDCFDNRMAAYSMLTPDTAFKQIWTEEAAVVRYYIIALSARGTLYRDVYMRKLRPRLKKIYHSLPSPVRTRFLPSRLWG